MVLPDTGTGVLTVAAHSSLSLTLPKSDCGKTPGMTPMSSSGVHSTSLQIKSPKHGLVEETLENIV